MRYSLDPIKFAALVVMAIEIGLLTPLAGINLYTVKAFAPPNSIALEEVFEGIALPFSSPKWWRW